MDEQKNNDLAASQIEPQGSPSNSSDLLAPFDEIDVLACEPFEGDFGEPGDRTLKDKMVNARKPGPCHLCRQEIKPRERVRTRADVSYGKIMTYRWCNSCCHAMALSWTDDGEAWEHRASLAR